MIIADTGFWLALANAKDHFHASKRSSPSCEAPIEGAFEVFDLEVGHLECIQVLMEKYRDLPMDLADGSLVILAEELGSGRILSTDQRDLRAYRWKTRKPFRNLLI